MTTSEQSRNSVNAPDWQTKVGAARLAATKSGSARTPMSHASLWIGIAILCSATAVLAEGAFKRLSAADIKKGLVGKIVTDGAHWSDKFKADGTLESIMQGGLRTGRWKLRGNDLCMIYSTRKENAEECYQVWRRQQRIEYRRDSDVIAEGELVDK
ncbi:hypothetical protein [Cupriavidus basilensis]|uniref:hypothetical protein n=1 Tax=Cupriavidus basilensis TaxID=68895 RepID=UPI0020A63ACF|nr:hypothetical protein [Cupriavidus basilensis]MCP3024048.1 hypothetical protein [Cupriavidus basilensis]